VIYLSIGAYSDQVGDYLIYVRMHKEGFYQSFDNQPIFTIYLEILRAFISHSELFFIASAAPLLFATLSKQANNTKLVIIIIAILTPAVISPESFYFLLRQNLATLVLHSLLPYNFVYAFIIASGFHYSFIVVFVSYLLYRKIIRLKSKTLSAAIVFGSYFVAYKLSTNLQFLLAEFIDSEYSIVSTYSNIYLDYDDIFPGILNLYIFALGAIVGYFLILKKETIQTVEINAVLIISTLLICFASSQSEAIQYRYLQYTKLSSVIIYSHLAYYILKKTLIKKQPKKITNQKEIGKQRSSDCGY
jgi:hypothetical protein